MSDVLTTEEVDGLRVDLGMLLGISEIDGNDDAARTVISFYREDATPTFDIATATYAVNPTALYSGPAAISPMVFRRDRQESGGDEAIRVRVYRCMLPWDADPLPAVDDYAIVDECDDPDVVGRLFWVVDVMFESEIAGRRVTLTDVTRDKVA